MDKKEERCEYCDGAKPIAIGRKDNLDNDDYGISIHYPNFLEAYGYDVHGMGSNGVSARINFCPMCGKPLEKPTRMLKAEFNTKKKG